MKTRPIVRIFLLVLGLILCLVLAASLLLPSLYQDRLPILVRTALTQDSGRVLAPFQSDISGLKNFPYLTVSLDNISLVDTSAAQPLEVLAVRHAEALVPVLQWPFGKLRISRLYLDGLTFQQRVDSAGNKVSLTFAKEKQKKDDPGSFALDIGKLRIQNASVINENRFKGSGLAMHLLDSDLQARVREGKLYLNGKLQGKIGYIASRGLRLFEGREFTADARYTFDFKQKLGRIEDSRAILNGNEVLITGTHQKMSAGQGSLLDLHFKGEQPFFFLLNQMSSIRSIPLFRQVESDGRVKLHFHIAGNSGPKQRPRNKLSFALEGGKLHWPTSRITLSNIHIAGQLDNGPKHSPESSTFTLHRLSAHTGQDSVYLQAKISDFTRPFVEARISGSYTLDSLAKVVPPDYLSLPRGTIAGDVRIKGNLHAIEDRQRDQDLQWQGAISLHDVGFQPAKLTVPFTNLNGEARLAGNQLQLQGIGGKIGGQPFSVAGSATDILNYLLGQHSTVTVNGAVKLKQVNTAWLKLKPGTKPAAAQPAVAQKVEAPTTILPEFLRLNMRLECERLNVKTTPVQHMKARLRSDGKRLTLSEIGLQSQGIDVTGNMTLPNDNRRLYAADLQLAAEMDSLDMTSMQQIDALAGSAGGGKAAGAGKGDALDFLMPLQKAQLSLLVRHVNLPGDEDLNNLSLRLNKKRNHVSMHNMRFRTTKGGAATANGGFFLTPRKSLTKPYLDVSLDYGFLDLQNFMQNFASLKTLLPPEETQALAEGKEEESSMTTKLREKVYALRMHIKAQELKYEFLKGNNVAIDARMNREQAQLDKLYLNAFGGTIFSQGVMYLNMPTDTIPVKLKAQVEDVNLEQLFAVAEQMELDVLGSQNIKGKADCMVTVLTKLDGTFTPSFDRTVAYTRATFRDMELIDIKPIQEALSFMRKERTQHLFFEDVDADFILHKNRFITPGFSLHNNLSTFDLRGSYTMGGNANLSMDINILQILFGNNERRIEKIQNDSLSLNDSPTKQHLLLVREQDKYKVKLSNRREREDISYTLRNEFLDVLQHYEIDTAFTEIKQ